jgi:hypothetical protein
MAELKFYANSVTSTAGSGELGYTTINHGAGSGLGFYGAGYGISVPIGQRQDSTWVTNSNGTATDNYQLHNTKMATVGSGTGSNIPVSGTVSSNGLTAINLAHLPNYLAPLNIRFTHTEAVSVQNCKLRIFDRNNINNHASGVSTYVYEVRHPATSQSVLNLSFRGRGETKWLEYDDADDSTVGDMAFTGSPGISGLNTDSNDIDTSLGYVVYTPNGAAHKSLQHDWYTALSAEPASIGSKTDYGLYFTIEYL